MKIKDELLHIASHLPAIHCVQYQSDFEANFNNTVEESNSIDFPFLQIIAYDTGNIQLQQSEFFSKYAETWQIGIYLCTKTEFDNSTAENQDLIECELKPLLRQFIGAVNNSDLFETITRVDYKIQHYKFNYFVTGVRAFFSLTEKVGTPIC